MSRARRLPRSENQSPPCLSNTRSFGPLNGCSPHLSMTVSTLPLCRSTRWIEPPIYSCGCGPGMIILPRGNPAEAAIVADVHLAVGPKRGAIGPAGNLRNDFLASIGIDPRQPPAADFDQHDRAVRHHHRPFRKLQIGSENANIGHEILPACLWLQADSQARSRTRNSIAHGYGKVAMACQARAGAQVAQGSPAATEVRRMGRAKRNPSIAAQRGDGFREDALPILQTVPTPSPVSRFPARHCR